MALGQAAGIKDPRQRGSKPGGNALILGEPRHPLREEKRETINIV
jgi:hypothetical protein